MSDYNLTDIAEDIAEIADFDRKSNKDLKIIAKEVRKVIGFEARGLKVFNDQSAKIHTVVSNTNKSVHAVCRSLKRYEDGLKRNIALLDSLIEVGSTLLESSDLESKEKDILAQKVATAEDTLNLHTRHLSITKNALKELRE